MFLLTKSGKKRWNEKVVGMQTCKEGMHNELKFFMTEL